MAWHPGIVLLDVCKPRSEDPSLAEDMELVYHLVDILVLEKLVHCRNLAAAALVSDLGHNPGLLPEPVVLRDKLSFGPLRASIGSPGCSSSFELGFLRCLRDLLDYAAARPARPPAFCSVSGKCLWFWRSPHPVCKPNSAALESVDGGLGRDPPARR